MHLNYLLSFICVVVAQQAFGLRQVPIALELEPGVGIQPEEEPGTQLEDELQKNYNELKENDGGVWLEEENKLQQGNDTAGRIIFSGSGSTGITFNCIGGSQGSKCANSCKQKFGNDYTGGCVNGRCRCTNNPTDVRCGPDGSFIGIRCPDVSACRRKCCRDGRTGGRCRGLFKLSCSCP